MLRRQQWRLSQNQGRANLERLPERKAFAGAQRALTGLGFLALSLIPNKAAQDLTLTKG